MKYIDARQYNKTNEPKGHANGYKPKTTHNWEGEITFAVPQDREDGYHPSALEKDPRSERWLVIALVGMYVQGISTREVKTIAEEFCGVNVSATQFSCSTTQLDYVFLGRFDKLPGEVTYLSMDVCYDKITQPS